MSLFPEIQFDDSPNKTFKNSAVHVLANFLSPRTVELLKSEEATAKSAMKSARTTYEAGHNQMFVSL